VTDIPWCGFIRREGSWRKCTYTYGYCKYWKECVEIWDIRSFAVKKLQILYENYMKEKESLNKELKQKTQAEARKNRKLSEYLP